MARKELPSGWINRKRYLSLQIGSWAILLGGLLFLFGYNFLIQELETLTFIIWLVVIIIANSIFKSSIVNKEKMETNKPMLELIRNIEGEAALVAVNELLAKEDLSNAMKRKYSIEKVYTLLYLGRDQEAKELLEQIERPAMSNDLFIYLELCFELSDNPRLLLEEEYNRLNDIQDYQARNTLDGILHYRESILDAEASGEPSQELREMIYTQRDIFTMLMNQYRIIRIYRHKSRYLTREACEKILEYANDLARFTRLANEVLEELGPVNEEEKEEAERAKEQGSAFLTFEDSSKEEQEEIEQQEATTDVIDVDAQEVKDDNNQ